MLNEQMLEKITREEAFEYNRLRECYWQSKDEYEESKFSSAAKEILEYEIICGQQLLNLMNYEKQLKAKYLITP